MDTLIFQINNTDLIKTNMWKTFIQSTIDYRSLIQEPVDLVLVSQIENLLQLYIVNTLGLENCDYWTRLRTKGFSSLIEDYREIQNGGGMKRDTGSCTQLLIKVELHA